MAGQSQDAGYTRRAFIAGSLVAAATMGAGGASISPAQPAADGAQRPDDVGARLLEKRFYDRARRHQRECYGAVLDGRPGSLGLAYLRGEGKRESLVYRPSPNAPEVVVARRTYILSPHFAGGRLWWVERTGRSDWRIRAVSLDDPRSESVVEPFSPAGRPMSLSSCEAGDATWLSWEERQGRRTRIRLAAIRRGRLRGGRTGEQPGSGGHLGFGRGLRHRQVGPQ